MDVDNGLLRFKGDVRELLAVRAPRRRNDGLAAFQRRQGVGAVAVGDNEFKTLFTVLSHVRQARGKKGPEPGELCVSGRQCGALSF